MGKPNQSLLLPQTLTLLTPSTLSFSPSTPWDTPSKPQELLETVTFEVGVSTERGRGDESVGKRSRAHPSLPFVFPFSPVTYNDVHILIGNRAKQIKAEFDPDLMIAIGGGGFLSVQRAPFLLLFLAS